MITKKTNYTEIQLSKYTYKKGNKFMGPRFRTPASIGLFRLMLEHRMKAKTRYKSLYCHWLSPKWVIKATQSLTRLSSAYLHKQDFGLPEIM